MIKVGRPEKDIEARNECNPLGDTPHLRNAMRQGLGLEKPEQAGGPGFGPERPEMH